jgi:hypothetical protein
MPGKKHSPLGRRRSPPPPRIMVGAQRALSAVPSPSCAGLPRKRAAPTKSVQLIDRLVTDHTCNADYPASPA